MVLISSTSPLFRMRNPAEEKKEISVFQSTFSHTQKIKYGIYRGKKRKRNCGGEAQKKLQKTANELNQQIPQKTTLTKVLPTQDLQHTKIQGIEQYFTSLKQFCA